jgi:hypothetical protein
MLLRRPQIKSAEFVDEERSSIGSWQLFAPFPMILLAFELPQIVDVTPAASRLAARLSGQSAI